MTITSTEQKIRATLPILRFMQTSIPLPVAHWLLEQGRARVRLDAGVIRESVTADGVPCEWIIPRNSPADPVLLCLHGSGFVFGLTLRSLDDIAHFLKSHLASDTKESTPFARSSRPGISPAKNP